jgi:hypothetical protein
MWRRKQWRRLANGTICSFPLIPRFGISIPELAIPLTLAMFITSTLLTAAAASFQCRACLKSHNCRLR